MKFIGVDPGSVSGNIAVISDDGYECFAFKNTTLREMYLFLYHTQSTINTDSRVTAILERVHGMPGMGVKSVSAFMKNVGHIEMALSAVPVSWKDVTPMTWMKHFNMKKEKTETKTMWKNRLKDLAERRMPTAPINRENADAFLIALYCKETYNN